ncbi:MULTISPECIES: hypothetical protein [unclassified Aureispira]|uniref:hypothetical protein n=1 Tax=unclassified Aureispira TaxID=2649989 RepID=UPI0007C7C735|nr:MULTISPECIES: hypothetical protein [unclassified Aureispira]WMX15667.1 hypothetical protein QP953_04640 [Aureispira sp. CCB-E]
MKNTTLKIIQLLGITLVIILMTTLWAEAQCPMCKMSAESNLNNGGTAAAGLNKGIIYLLIGPYIMMSIVGYLWWRNRKMVQEQEQEEDIRALLEPHDMVISSTEFNETVDI